MHAKPAMTSLFALALLAGCAGDPASGELALERTPAPAADVSSGRDAPAVPGAGIERLAERARQDLARRLGIEAGDIKTQSAGYVSWRDSSLGCPAPGTQALQVLTPGARILLEVDGRTYHYHSGPKRPPVLCRTPSELDPLPYAPGEA